MKRIVWLIVMSVFILTACGIGTYSETATTAPHTSEEDWSEYTATDDTLEEDGNMDIEVEDEENRWYYSIVDGTDFSCDVAWVEIENEEYPYALIDRDGRIIFTCQFKMDPFEECGMQGKELVVNEEKEFLCLNTYGSIEYRHKQTEEDTVLELISYEGKPYVFHYLKEESYDGIKNTLRVTDLDDNAIVEWTDREKDGFLYKKPTIIYLDEGHFALMTSNVLPDEFYNIEDGSVVEDCEANLVSNKFHENCLVSESRNNVILYNGRGEKVIKIERPEKKGFVGKMLSEGLLFADDGYYNIEGQKVIDLSAYNVTQAADFINGVAAITITNENKTPFTTLIDRNGKFIFEPVKGSIDKYDGDVLKINYEDAYYHYDMEGNLVATYYDEISNRYGFEMAWERVDVSD